MRFLNFYLVIIFLLSFFIIGCGIKAIHQENEYPSDIEKIEIIHFHGNNQCFSCITVGDYAEETINTYFKKEIDEGFIEFKHLNGQLPENKDLVLKYGATGSSLWIGTYFLDGTFKAEQNINVWYKVNNKEDYMNYLKSEIEKKW
jgi:hypothetical protein